MGFKTFFTEAMLIDEAESVVGDAMEGIFAIAVALYIADGKIDVAKLNEIRKRVIVKPKEPFQTMVDSNIAADGWIANKLPHIQPGNKLAVKVVINLKATTKTAFGPTSKPIPDIESTINTMTKQIAGTKAIKRIEAFIVKVLTDRSPDNIIFYVVADGSQTSASKDEIKGDVMLRVEAKTNTPVPEDIEAPVRFSIKTDTSKTAQLSIFTAILRMGNFFGLPLTKGLENMSSFPTVGGAGSNKIWDMIRGPGAPYAKQAQDPTHLLYYVRNVMTAQDRMYGNKNSDNAQALSDAVEEQYWMAINKATEVMEAQLQKKDATYDFSKRTFDFLVREIFGSDDAEVIKLLPGSISEISKEDYEELRRNYTVEMAVVGDEMKFSGVHKITGKRDILFTISPEVTVSGKQRVMRFAVELGPLLYKTVA
jgi:hypothetical protein